LGVKALVHFGLTDQAEAADRSHWYQWEWDLVSPASFQV